MPQVKINDQICDIELDKHGELKAVMYKGVNVYDILHESFYAKLDEAIEDYQRSQPGNHAELEWESKNDR